DAETSYDGILGFSEGASAAASLILRQSAQGYAKPFKFAFFFCGPPPLDYQDKGVILADESGARINIPTAHIVGSRDPGYLGSLALYNLCDERLAGLYNHGKDHTIPWDPQSTGSIAKELRLTIQRSSESASEISGPL
ncbi:MAG: hypothetical protein Q9198_008676, partial [Flavoplaca austrocitrina]